MSGLSCRLRLLCAVCLAGLFFALSVQPGATTPKGLPIQYTMLVDVDYDKAFLNVTQVVKVPNRSDSPMTSLVFNVPPVYFDAFMLSSVTIDNAFVTAKQTAVLLEIPLPQPLALGDTATATLRWWGQLPPSDGRYGAADGVLVLGNWYPMLAVFRNGDWERHQYTPIGDAFFSEVADYDVTVKFSPTVNVSPTVTVAGSGALVSRNGGQWVFRSQNARDFALAVSSKFQTLTRKVDNVTITVYYYGDRGDGAKTSLDIADQATRWYNKKIGPYPYPTLAIVQIPSTGQHVAQEHAGLFTLRSDIFTPQAVGIYTAHELAHAWFFGAVGNDQIREPWMDEGLVNSVSLDFYREMYPKEFPGVWGSWGGAAADFKNTDSLNRGIFDFQNGSVYFYSVYRQGAAFFQAVRDAMGDDAYWQALRTYYDTFYNSIAEPRDLLRLLRQAGTRTDILPIFTQFLDYPYLKYANLAIDIAVPDDQTWQGKVAVPILVAADCPTYTLSVMLDGKTITTTASAVTITVDTSSLSDGAYVLRAVASDEGLNRSDVQRSFGVSRPTPTPSPTATRTATATVAATAVPTTLATASPTPAAQAAAPAEASELRWSAVVLGLVLAFAALVAALRMRRS